MKKYLNIKEASEITGLAEHVIRYWDSIDPKTNQLRVQGISTKSKGGTRYFNRDNIEKIEKIKNLLYENGYHNPSLKLAQKFLSEKKIKQKNEINVDFTNINKKPYNLEKISQILKNMRNLLK